MVMITLGTGVGSGICDIAFDESADGERFLVLNINTRNKNENLLKHYARSRQYAEAAEWMSGEKLPVYVYGHPALYMQCKQGKDAMSVGLWNFFADEVSKPIVELYKSFSEIKFINCNGKIHGDKVYLDKIPPFGFAAFEVR